MGALVDVMGGDPVCPAELMGVGRSKLIQLVSMFQGPLNGLTETEMYTSPTLNISA